MGVAGEAGRAVLCAEAALKLTAGHSGIYHGGGNHTYRKAVGCETAVLSAVSAFVGAKQLQPARVYVYIDGFNFYYGAVKGTPYKWLNFERLCSLLFPKEDVVRIKYFTARVRETPWDQEAPRRQQLFLRALATLPKVEVIFGNFRSHVVKMPLAVGNRPSHQVVEVYKTEEKRSDVNMATHLLCDAFEDRFDIAGIVTNDSDLALPIKVVRERLGKRIVILYPSRRPASLELRALAHSMKPIRKVALENSLFPDVLQDARGTFRKPESW